MSAILAIAGLLVTATPLPPVEAVDAAYEEVSTAQNAATIARIEAKGPVAHAHPAQLINLGVAYARTGDTARARALFQRAAKDGAFYSLESADGTWTSSRTLALRALSSLDGGAFARSAEVRTASR